MGIAHDPRTNHLLAALPGPAWQRLLPQLEAVDLPLGRVLKEAGQAPGWVWFPTTAIVSLMYMLSDGDAVEVAMVGSEGMVGATLFMGSESTPSRAVVQCAGRVYRIGSRAIKDEFDRAGPVMHLMLRYAQSLLTQMAQSAVCNRHHSLDQKLCRWLLLCLDRLQGNELAMTQELIATMLGVRREGVTEATLHLQAAGIIHHVRGHITVTDRLALERRACECYAVVKKECDRLLPDLVAA